MTDLFSQPAPHEDAYGHNLLTQVRSDLLVLAERGITPPWHHRESVLDRDEYKILTLIADTGGNVYYGGGKDRAALAVKLGFLSTGNLEAAVKKTTERGLVRMVTAGDRIRMSMTELGRYMLEQSEDEDGWDCEVGDDPD